MSKKTTILKRLITTNILMILLVGVVVMVASNIALGSYFKQSTKDNFNSIIHRLGPIINDEMSLAFPKDGPIEGIDGEPPSPKDSRLSLVLEMEHVLKTSLPIIHSNYIILDSELTILNSYQYEYLDELQEEYLNVVKLIDPESNVFNETIEFSYQDKTFIGMTIPIEKTAESDASYLILYSPMKWMDQLSFAINMIIGIIVLMAIGIAIAVSIIMTKKIARPFSLLNQHLRDLANQRFKNDLLIPVDDELKDFVQNINHLSKQLEQSNQAQKEFFQNMSHDLRTPIMAIESYAEGILYDVTDPKDSANVILSESHRMKVFVEEMLYLSSLQKIDQQPFETIDLVAVLNKTNHRMAQLAKTNHMTIHLDIHDITAGTCMIMGNNSHIDRALDNLIINGLSYGKSYLDITLSLDDTHAEIVIRDDGMGIEDADLPSVFNRFEKGKDGHIGLGLAIVQAIVNQHHGSIQAKNTDNGAAFVLRLPLAKTS